MFWISWGWINTKIHTLGYLLVLSPFFFWGNGSNEHEPQTGGSCFDRYTFLHFIQLRYVWYIFLTGASGRIASQPVDVCCYRHSKWDFNLSEHVMFHHVSFVWGSTSSLFPSAPPTKHPAGFINWTLTKAAKTSTNWQRKGQNMKHNKHIILIPLHCYHPLLLEKLLAEAAQWDPSGTLLKMHVTILRGATSQKQPQDISMIHQILHIDISTVWKTCKKNA